MSNFIVFWPGKKIPADFERITFEGQSDGIPEAFFGGFGFAWHDESRWNVRLLSGSLLWINGAGMSVRVEGQRGGVNFLGVTSLTVTGNKKD